MSAPSRAPTYNSPRGMLSGGSTLMTSAPKSANCLTQLGPARTWVRSMTLNRPSAPDEALRSTGTPSRSRYATIYHRYIYTARWYDKRGLHAQNDACWSDFGID